MSCGRCKKDDCGGQCAMDKAFGSIDSKSLIYSNIGFKGSTVSENLETIEELTLNLPDVEYILENIVNYMFTNSLTVRDTDKDKKMYDYLYGHNFNGQRNLDVIKEVAKGYHKYGYYGLLNTGEGLIGIHPSNIVACVISNKNKPVLSQCLTYLITNNNNYYTNYYHSPYDRKTGNPKTVNSQYSEEQVLDIIANPEKYKKEVMVVTEDNFSCVRLDTSKVFCMSPLLKDRKRVSLILNILDRMNYDIARNGIGTIAMQAKDTLEEQITESVEQGASFTGTDLIAVSRTVGEERKQAIAKEIEKFAEELSKTEFNDALVYGGNFQNLQQLTRDTKSTDFLDFLSQYVPAIVCQMFGVPARLFDLNKTVSNIGTYSIIDNAMKNTIIPKRDHFLGQIMNMLAKAVGLPNEHIKFASYEFTNNYNYNNDIYILDVYERLLGINKDLAEQYLTKNLIV